MDDVEPDSDGDKDYDSDKDPAWKPGVSSHSNATATAHVSALYCLGSLLAIFRADKVFWHQYFDFCIR